MDNFTREELQDIRQRAAFASEDPNANIFTKIAYLELASAADRLDSMLARNELANQSPQVWPTRKK